MIVLDTNVISELARLAPDPGVLSWLDSLEARLMARPTLPRTLRSSAAGASTGEMGRWAGGADLES